MSDPEQPGTYDARSDGDPSSQEQERSRLLAQTRDLQHSMVNLALQVRDLILGQPPVQLLAYLLGKFHLAVLTGMTEEGDAYRPDKDLIKDFQLILEYLHAVWASHPGLRDNNDPLVQSDAENLLVALKQLEMATMLYCMASSAANHFGEQAEASASLEFHAKSSWVLIRGHRYQVLESEFFRFALEPHSAALLQAYGMEYHAIADAIQSIADSFRAGFGASVQKLIQFRDETLALAEASGQDLRTVISDLKSRNPSLENEMSGAIRDMLFGGIANLSRHTELTPPLLEDLSYLPGENTTFFSDGEFSGTPMRTPPARIKPGIKLGDDYYVTDGQFIRDSSYRAIQWGLWKRLSYRDEWLRRQGKLLEQAFTTIFKSQLKGARTIESAFYRDIQTNDWVEADLIILFEDVLIAVESKAGVMPMQSPATNFSNHERAIQKLIVDAYDQSRRLFDYMCSKPEVEFYNLIDGSYVEVGRLRFSDYRLSIPIGLTLEAFTPFSAMAKDLPGVEPILGRHAYISMSADDLFVLNRFLPTTGELMHYLEVRQQIAGIRGALLFDELDHLGAYVSHNRFDQDIKEQLKEADYVTWDSFSDKVDHYFEKIDWETHNPPGQPYPEALSKILAALDRLRPRGWLHMDAFLRDFGAEGREDLADLVDQLVPTLTQYDRRRLLLGKEVPLQMWVCRPGRQPLSDEVRRQAEVGSLITGTSEVMVLTAAYRGPDEIVWMSCDRVRAPSVLQPNFGELWQEAEKQRGRTRPLG